MSEHLSADMAVEFWASQRGVSVEQVGIAPIVVGSWDLGTVKSLAGTVGAASSPSWWWGPRFPLYNGEIGGKKVSFVNLPLGAPATVMVMEELIACGTRVFLGLGLAGSIQPEAPVGTCFIPTSCVREEGTSPHYLSSDEGLRPAQRLVRAVERLEAGHWPTGAGRRLKESRGGCAGSGHNTPNVIGSGIVHAACWFGLE